MFSINKAKLSLRILDLLVMLWSFHNVIPRFSKSDVFQMFSNISQSRKPSLATEISRYKNALITSKIVPFTVIFASIYAYVELW